VIGARLLALVTLALSQVVLLTLVAAREVTGGSLGMTLTIEHSWWALQFASKETYLIALVVWVAGLAAWR
jgi:branched-chain amino acid transport system permease protein